MSVHTVSVRELRPHLSDVLMNVVGKFDRYIITKRGKPEAVLLSIEDYEGMLETMDIQRDAQLMRRIKKAEQDMKLGKGKSLDRIKQELYLV